MCDMGQGRPSRDSARDEGASAFPHSKNQNFCMAIELHFSTGNSKTDAKSLLVTNT